jgi:hypothetical protein
VLNPKFVRFRPSSVHIALVLAAPLFLLSVAGCGAQPASKQDTWKLTPPEILGTTRDGIARKQSAKNKQADQETLGFNLESYLKFSKADRGLSLEFDSRCGDLSFRGNAITSEFVSLARMVPPQLLSESRSTSPCQILISVKNQLGSVHHFELKNVLLVANTFEEKILDILQIPQPATRHEPLRLVCGGWWTEEDNDSVNASLSIEARIQSLSRAESVNGLDDRKQRFRPLCRLFQLHGDARLSFLGSIELALPGLETRLTKAVTLTPGTHYTFLNKPLMEWALLNSSQRRQTVFVTNHVRQLKMSYANVMTEAPFGWSKMIRVPYEFRFLSGHSRVDTANGTFFELPPGESLKMQLKLAFDAHCMVSLEKRGTPYLRFELDSPISYFVLSQDLSLEQIGAAKDQFAMESLTKHRHKLIFSSQLIEFGQSQNEIIDGGTFADAEKRIGPSLLMPMTNSSRCFYGQMFAVPESSRRPVVE